MQYAGYAEILLSLIPLIRGAVGDASYASADVLLNFSTDAVVDNGVALTSSGIDEVAKLELSNAQIAHCFFSERNMREMSPNSQTIITEAVEKSDFLSMDEFRNELKTAVRNSALEEKHVAIFDLGYSLCIENGDAIVLDSKASKFENE